MAASDKTKRPKVSKNPLWLHKGTGQWCKKIKGRVHYFGADLGEALQRYDAEKAQREAGIIPGRTIVSKEPTIAEVCNAYLATQAAKVEADELSPRTFSEQKGTCEAIVKHFGRHRRVADLQPPDFGPFRATLAKRYGPTRLANEIVRARSVFKHAYENNLIATSVRFGTAFKLPPKRKLRQHANERKQALQPLTPAELKTLIENANVPMKAFILLGINAAFGSADIGTLPLVSLDLDNGWCEHPRAKTAVRRRTPLWNETIEAVRAAMADRPEPATDEFGKLAFLTCFGRPWYRVSDITTDDEGEIKGGVPIDSIAQEWGKLLRKLKLTRKGIGFYHLRHLFQTVAEDMRDSPAIDCLMGHVDDSMADPYRINIPDDRLKAVTDHVRSWLYPPKPKDEDDAGDDAPEEVESVESRDAQTPDGKPQLRIVG